MFLKVYGAEKIYNAYFKFYLNVNILLIFISFSGFFTGAGIDTTFAGISFLIVVTVASLNYRFRNNPLSSIFCFFTLIYLSIPCCFILVQGSEYLVGISVGKLPFDQNDYQQNRAFGFIYLSVCWLSVWFGIYFKKFNSNLNLIKLKYNVSLKSLLIMSILVAIITTNENNSFISVKINNSEHVTSLIAFLLLDHAFLVLSGILLFDIINKLPKILNSIKNTIIFIFILFVFVGFIAGSKGSLLVVFVLLILYPFFLSTQFNGAKLIFIRPIYLVTLAILAPLLFYLAMLKRLSLFQGTEFDILQTFSLASEIQYEMIADIVSSIFYRLAWGGLDQFLLLFYSYVHEPYDFVSSSNFTQYIFKNTINLILPGTPFPEAYAPSSQLFSSVLLKEILISEFDKTSLIISFNTQPYTLFGVFMIVFGIFSPLLIFLFTFIFSSSYNYYSNILIKAILIYFFSSVLSSYAFESVIGATFNVVISILFMYFLMIIFSKFKFK